MTKTIDTLVGDIYELVTDSGGIAKVFRNSVLSERLADRIGTKLSEDQMARNGIGLSQIGKPCHRQLWYNVHSKHEAEPLPGPSRIKFLYGDILEELIIYLAKETGHTVEGEQDEVSIEGVTGHIDCIIDGVVCDVKSASTWSFQKFVDHLQVEQDSFGYLGQINAYLYASQQDRRVLTKDLSCFIAIDKTLGKICIDKQPKDNVDYSKKVQFILNVLEKPVPPQRGFNPVPDGKSGNMKLGVECSYCPFKNKCYEGLRTFIYSKGPVFLTKVVRVPDVLEIKEFTETETET